MKKVSVVKKISAFITVSYAFLVAGVAHGVSSTAVPSSVPGKGLTMANLSEVIGKIATWLMEIGVALAVVFIVIGGIQYMLAGGDEEKATKARGRIFNGIIGAAVVIAAGIIIRTVVAILPELLK